MINIEIAGLPIGIDTRYSYLSYIAKEHITDKEPLFTVSVSDEQIKSELAKLEEPLDEQYLEASAIFRRIGEELPLYSGFVFHGAVIALDGVAYAVTARSGVGKTTHLSLWLKEFGDRVHILNGDKPVLRIIDGRVYACATPWRGKEGYGVNEMLPLGGIGFIRRAARNSAAPLTPPAALIDFISQIYIPNRSDTARLALSLADTVLKSVPLFSLSVNMDPEAAHVAMNAFVNNKF